MLVLLFAFTSLDFFLAASSAIHDGSDDAKSVSGVIVLGLVFSFLVASVIAHVSAEAAAEAEIGLAGVKVDSFMGLLSELSSVFVTSGVHLFGVSSFVANPFLLISVVAAFCFVSVACSRPPSCKPLSGVFEDSAAQGSFPTTRAAFAGLVGVFGFVVGCPGLGATLCGRLLAAADLRMMFAKFSLLMGNFLDLLIL